MWTTTTMTVVDNGVRGSLDFELMHVSHGPVLVEARCWTIQTSTTREPDIWDAISFTNSPHLGKL